jgi:hypothetical protein
MATKDSAEVLVLAERLFHSLDQIGNALVALDGQALLAGEEALGELLRSSPTSTRPSGAADQRPELRRVVARGRAALLRAKRLGSSLEAVARARLHACNQSAAYGRAGEAAFDERMRPVVKVSA